MPKRPTAYYRPKHLAEALALLEQPHTMPLAGGTKLLAGDVEGAVVDLQDVGLDQIWPEDGWLHIGATTKLNDLADYLARRGSRLADGKMADLLQVVIHKAGPNTYRNAATIGGTVAARLPDSELLAALLVLNAQLVLQQPGPSAVSLVRYLAVEVQLPGLITAIRLLLENGVGSTERVSRTPADYPIVSITGWQAAGEVPRLAATGIDIRPVRLDDAESKLGAHLDESAIVDAAAAVKAQANHPGDFRGDAAYRADMAAVLTRRTLHALRAAASGSSSET
ncbi:MAG: FAD binding domain-containing protein [Candidatus Promineifilaceae bacterium]